MSRITFVWMALCTAYAGGCGLDGQAKNSCTRQSDCLDGFTCNAERSTCEPEGADAGAPDARLDVDACAPAVVSCEPGQCGAVPDGCGGAIECGGCTAPDECGGGGVDNVCGCTGETQAELCALEGLVECGSADLVDRCGNERSISCGRCSGAEQCGAWSLGTCDEIACTESGWCRALGPTLAGDLEVRGLWGDGSGQVWAAASDATPMGRVLHFDGVSWSTAMAGAYRLRGVAGAGNDLWLVSRYGEVLEPAGASFSVLDSSNRNWFSVVAISPTDVWAVGSVGSTPQARALHFDGASWTETAFGTWEDLNWRFLGVSASAWNSVWAVGFDGNNGSVLDTSGPLVASFDGVEWSMHSDLPTSHYLYAVWVVGDDDVWAVGESGTIVHYDGNQWTLSDSGVSQDLFAVTEIDGDVWAAGSAGVLLKRVGTTWVPQQSGTSRTIRALWANSTTDIWAGGDDGLLLHYSP